MKAKIKEYLREDSNLLIDILEELAFHNIKRWSKKEIRASLPDGDCPSAVSIKLNTWLNVDIYTRTDFDNYHIKDLFSLIMFVTGRSLEDTEQYLCFKLGMEYDPTTTNYRRSDVLKTIRRFKTNTKTEDFIPTYLDDSEFEKYTPSIVKEWVDEGIDAETQKLFKVCVSKRNGRWSFPLYDEVGLRAFKGRTSNIHWKSLGLMKYLYMPKIGRNDIMFGYNLTKEYIKEAGEVIIFEAEKSVMKMWANNVRNCIAVGKHGVNPHVLPKIKALRVKVVIASDKGICEKDLIKECKKLNHLTETSYIWDENDLLGEKDSPIDCGLVVFEELYEDRKWVR